jgi:NADPH:quinone reductase-like Zn-dependent oxidoreductase
VQAVIVENESLRLEQRDTPDPAEGQVLVQVDFAGINAADLLQKRGVYPAPPGWPSDVPGMELSGRVVRVGPDVDASLVGRSVCTIVGGGAQATHCIVPAAHLLEVPAQVPMDQAGGFPEAFITAFDALVLQGRLCAGERVLVSGASGGVGTAALQIAKLLGAHVTAVTRSDSHAEQLRQLGADDVISLEDVPAIEPVDVVVELVGAAHLSLAQNRLAPRARVVVIGVGAGSRVDINLLNVMATRATLTGSTLRSRDNAEKAQVIARVADALVTPWRDGRVRVPLAATFPLAQVDAAYDFFARPGKFGKVVLDVRVTP